MDVKDLVDELSEAGVIASLIYKPELCYHDEDLSERHFSDPVNSIIFYAIKEMVKKNIYKVDAINILSMISEGNKKIEKMSKTANITSETIDEIISLGQNVARTTPEEYKALADNVRIKAFKREMYKALKKCETYCFMEDEKDVQIRVQDEINGVTTDYSTVEDLKTVAEIADSLFEEVENVQTGGNFLDFKIEALNEYCRLAKKALIVTAGKEKRGKSIWTMNTLITLLNNDESVLYIDTEIDTLEFIMRVQAHMAQVEYRKIETGKLTTEERARVQKVKEWIKTKTFVHRYLPVLTDVELINTVNKMKNKYGITACMVDYLKSNGEFALDAYKNSQYMGKMTDVLKNTVAGKMGLYTFACCQQNKDGSIANSANIARNCSALLSIDRKTDKEIAEDGGREFGNMKLTVIANRSGKLHSEGEYISLGLNGDMCTFYDCKQPIRAEPF